MNEEQKLIRLEKQFKVALIVLRKQSEEDLLEDLYKQFWKNRFEINFVVINSIKAYNTIFDKGAVTRSFWWICPDQGWTGLLTRHFRRIENLEV